MESRLPLTTEEYAPEMTAPVYADETSAHLANPRVGNPSRPALAAMAVLALLLIRRGRKRRARERAEQALAMALTAALSRPSGFSRAGSAVSDAIGRMSGFAAEAGETVSHALGDASERAQALLASERAQPLVESTRRMLATIEDSSRARPLPALGVALMTGALLASLLRR